VDYFLGAYRVLSDHIALSTGIRIVFTSDLPAGAGLSSSSALTCGFLLGLNALLELKKTREDLAWLAHLVERNFIGLQGGIMDQHACLLCMPGNLLLLDCLDRSYTQIRFPADGGLHLFLIDTRVPHKLTDSDYNARASECRQALAIMQSIRDIRSLREATHQDLQQHATLLGPVLTQRVDFVLRENARVLSSVECIHRQDWKQLGQLLFQSHAGLRDDYKVSCAELDFLVDAVSASPDILGARMMGGGFGGCTINLATRPMDAVFRDALQRSYVDHFGRECAFIDIAPSSGALVEMI
jgi:galactokinase